MARLLAQGTGATWAQVWLIVSGRLTLAATLARRRRHRSDAPSRRRRGRWRATAGTRALRSATGVSCWGCSVCRNGRGWPHSRRGAAVRRVGRAVGPGADAGRLRAELEIVGPSSGALGGDRASRERRHRGPRRRTQRLERDIHDGAQQHLVALPSTCDWRRRRWSSPDRAAAVLDQAAAALVAIETLSALARGIYPRQLADEGLGAALRSAVAAGAMPVTIDTHGVARLPAPVEAALYFCGIEAVQNAAKHSGAGRVPCASSETRQRWQLTVTDDGHGFDPTDAHCGIRHGACQYARSPRRGRWSGGRRILRPAQAPP